MASYYGEVRLEEGMNAHTWKHHHLYVIAETVFDSQIKINKIKKYKKIVSLCDCSLVYCGKSLVRLFANVLWEIAGHTVR